MMLIGARWILLLGFLASALAAGLPYWFMPYNQVNLPNALYGPGLLVLFVASAIVRICEVVGFWKGVAILASSLVAVVLARVIVETAADPTSHNLWPFEIVIAFALGGLCALSGAVVGWLLVKLRTRPGE